MSRGQVGPLQAARAWLAVIGGSMDYQLEADSVTGYFNAWNSAGTKRSMSARDGSVVSVSTLPRGFAAPTVEAIDRRRNYGEERIRSIGEIDGRIYVVVYTDRPGMRWIISAWKASGRDVRTWLSRE